MVDKIPGAVFRRELRLPLSDAVGAKGVYIEDSRGNRYLDASGGPLVTNVGHGREEIAKAVHEQILKCDYVHPTMFTGEPVERLATDLSDVAPEGIDRFYFMSSGSEAVETAIKLARQIHLERGNPERYKLISRWKSYHGLTLGALSATGRTSFRKPFAPLLTDVSHIEPPYCYRCAFNGSYPSCDLRCAAALEETIVNLGSDTVSAFLAETVSGATIAAAVPPPGYWRRIREICDRYGVFLILDEVFCGLGRTGSWFASERHGVVPDMVLLGKGLSGGVMGLSAVGIQGELFDTIRRSSGHFVHGGTFSHHQVACAAGNAVLSILRKEALVERVDKLGVELGEMLRQSLSDHPNVGDVRGVGFMWGVEFVRDRETHDPFPRSVKLTEKIWRRLYDRGILLYKSTGLTGSDGDALIIGPPFITRKNELRRVVDDLREAVEEVFKEEPSL